MIRLRQIGLLTVGVVLACTGDPAGPKNSRAIRFSVADTTLDIGDLFQQRVVDAARPDSVIPPSAYLLTSSDTNVLAVYTGYPFGFRARHGGTATLTATLRDAPDVAAHLTVTVRPPRVFLTNLPAGNVVETGATLSLPARFTGAPSDAVFSRSSDPTVLAITSRVPETVMLQAIRPGTATITVLAVADSSYRATYAFTVVAPVVASITASPASIRLRGRDDSTRVIITMRSASGAYINDRLPTATTSDASIARPLSILSENGSISLWARAVAAGSATLKVESGTQSIDIPVTVNIAASDSGYVNSGASIAIAPTFNDAPTPGSPQLSTFVDIAGIAAPPRHGTATLGSATRIDYTATRGWVGPDTILYLARDHVTGMVDTGVVRVNVLPGPFTAIALTPPPGTTIATIAGLNNRGEVAVTLRSAADSSLHAARWALGSFVVLGPISSSGQTAAVAINNLGDELVTTTGSGPRPAIWKAGSATATFIFSDTTSRTAVDMNDPSQVLLDRPPALWDNGVVKSLLPAGSFGCYQMQRLNNRGEVLARSACSSYNNWLLLNSTRNVYSGCWAGRYSDAYDINDSATVVGTAENQLVHRPNVCVWRAGVPAVDAHQTLGEWLTSLTRINNADWMLGTATYASRSSPALVVNGMVLPFASYATSLAFYPWTIDSVVEINDRGQILAWGTQPDGTRSALLLTPAVQP